MLIYLICKAQTKFSYLFYLLYLGNIIVTDEYNIPALKLATFLRSEKNSPALKLSTFFSSEEEGH